ncbi:MAG: HAD-IIIA family hydrolase [Candidatus Zixiibacteriota bacterium]
MIRFGSLGDVVLTAPVITNLKIAYPRCRITFLTKEQFAPVVRMFSGVDDVQAIAGKMSLRRLYSTLLDLDHQNFDIVVDLHGNLRSWLSRTIVGSPRTLWYPKRRKERWLIVHRKKFPTDDIHTVEAYNAALAPLGITTPCRRPSLEPRDTAESPLPVSTPYIVVAPGAAHANKQYPLERFAESSARIAQERNVSIVWAVTTQDANKSGLENSLGAKRFVELVDRPLDSLGNVLAGALMTLSNDSGLMHLSSAVGTPVVSIFGPTHPALGFSPTGQFDQILQVDEPCRPCSLHGKKKCYRTERFCFTRIAAGDVALAAGALIERRRDMTPALLVDRDGTLIVDKDYLADPAGVELIPGAAAALKQVRDKGYKVVVLSNQSGVARGKFGLDAVDRVNNRLKELLGREGVTLDGIYFCPHYPGGIVPEFTLRCDCRKPFPGMAEQAARDLNLDLRRSWVVGDKLDDLNLASAIGASAILVRTGYGRASETELTKGGEQVRVPVVDSLAQVVPLIV